MTNSIRLLEAEIKREEAELAKEKTRLDELNKNAKAAKAARKRQSKNVCRVIRPLGLELVTYSFRAVVYRCTLFCGA